ARRNQGLTRSGGGVDRCRPAHHGNEVLTRPSRGVDHALDDPREPLAPRGAVEGTRSPDAVGAEVLRDRATDAVEHGLPPRRIRGRVSEFAADIFPATFPTVTPGLRP